MYFLLIVVASLSLSLVVAYPSGAPIETCSMLNANHTDKETNARHLPQVTEAPYEIIVPSTASTDQTIDVIINGVGGEKFKGFYIQGESQSTLTRVGHFESSSGVAQTLDCDGSGSKNAATHINANDKSQVTLKWRASSPGRVVFRAIIVKNYATYWKDLRSSVLRVE